MKQYTAGQLADLAGVSPRTIRYYDQKGLLNPVGRSEGGYRLYDSNSLLQIQQIIMLKFAGLTLDEICTALKADQVSLWERLEDQKQLLARKISQLQEIVALLNGMEQSDAADPERLVETMQLVRRINHSARTYHVCREHGVKALYPWEFDQLGLKPGQKLLDVGCGYGMIWRHSWERIPENMEITLLDIWQKNLDMLKSYCEEQKDALQAGITIHFRCEDIETAVLTESYDHILMAYMSQHIKQPEPLLDKLYDALVPDGVLSFIVSAGASIQGLDELYRAFSGESCLAERQDTEAQRREIWAAMLGKRFPSVEVIAFDNELVFEQPMELYQFMMDSYQELVQALTKQGSRFVSFLRKHMAKNGPVTIKNGALLYRCKKEGA